MDIFKEVLSNVLELDAQFKSASLMYHSRNSSAPPSHVPSNHMRSAVVLAWPILLPLASINNPPVLSR